MAVKAMFTTTIYKSIDIANTKLYYKLVNAGSTAPDKPTTLTPSGWSTTEPTFNISKDLYATMETIYSDNSFTYSDVTKYSSYEAAKQAYNTATNAQTTANTASSTATTALNKINNLHVGGTNLELKTATWGKWNSTSGITISGDVSSFSTQIYPWYGPIEIEIGKKYSIGVDVKSDEAHTPSDGIVLLDFFNSNNTRITYQWLNASYTTNWVRKTWTFTVPNNADIKKLAVGFRNTAKKKVYFRHLKVETGDIATDWTPASEDVDLKIDGKIESYYQSSDPSSSWSTSIEKETHIGDIWYNTTNQKTFVYYKNNTNPVTYEWKWQNVPTELIDSVNGKATIYSGVVPANYSVGDYWLIPLNCYTNTYSLTSQTGEYSVNQTIKLDRYTLTVTGINSSTHAITSYTVNVPSNSNYSLAETISDGMLTLTISSNASFTLPTGCYGGSMCVATTAGTSYNASHWVKRNDYTPKDKTDTYATETNLNNNVLNLDGNINSNYSDLDGKINDNYLLLNGKIDGNYDDLSGTMSTNFSGLNGRTSSLEQYRTEFSGTYAKDKGDIVLREEALEDRLVTRIQATSGGNNLLRNSVGFRNTKYWTSPSSGIIEQTYSTLPQQMVTINFRWKKSGSNPAQIKLGYYSAGTFVEKYTVLNTSTATTEWASASFTYTSSNNNPVIRINDVFTSLQDSEASTNGLSGSRLVFSTNGLTITDLIISYGGGKNWSPYYNELYGSTFNLDADGFDIRESLSDKHSHLDANGLTFLGANNSIEGVFSKSETKTDNLYLTNAQYIGNLHIINIDNNNIIEY